MPIPIANSAFCSPAEALHTKMMYSTAEWLQDCRLVKCLVQHWAMFSPSISFYFTFECFFVLCWYHGVTLHPQSFIAVTERCPWGRGVVTKDNVLQHVRRNGGRGVWKASAPSFNKFTPALSITLLITCQERAWPEATLTEPTANSPETRMCFYRHGWMSLFNEIHGGFPTYLTKQKALISLISLAWTTHLVPQLQTQFVCTFLQ